MVLKIHDVRAENVNAFLEFAKVSSESQVLEFKRLGAGKLARILETVCAFANTQGGWIIVGLADEKEVKPSGKYSDRLYGVQENVEALDELQRKCLGQFDPPEIPVSMHRVSCVCRDGQPGHLIFVRVNKSESVHSIVGGGTYTRMGVSNRQMTAAEVTELSYSRGARSAASDPVDIPLERIQTDVWRRFSTERGPLTGTFADQLIRLGLAVELDGKVCPRKAAVLLFAEEPGSLLAAFDGRADIRLMIYDGKTVVPGVTPNLRKRAKTLRGPLIDQIDAAVRTVQDELAQGLTLSSSGFRTVHLYPERVVREAIVNAVVHRDYRLNRDIFIRVFDDRIEIESPGRFPGVITSANVSKMGSKARNPLIATNLREFPSPPNIDAGEGVKMMFAEMARAELFPPQYRETIDTAIASVTVTLLNLQRPTAWDEVSDWLDRKGSIANADLVRIAKIDTLKASKLLGTWRDQGLVVPLPGRGKRNMAYSKPALTSEGTVLLSRLEDNN